MDDNKSSMLYWYEKIVTCDVPQLSHTEIIPIEIDLYEFFDGNTGSLQRYNGQLDKAAEGISYPLFMRTDHYSGKHSWTDTCYVERNWRDNILTLLDRSYMADLPINAIVFRRYIEMDSVFTAFNGMPVNPERRYFIVDGEIICHHPYWIPDAIEQGTLPENLPINWRELLAEANTESPEEILLLGGYAGKIARRFREGGWSVDFCKGKDGVWYFIDMAEAWRSWHPDCPNKTSMPSPLSFDYGEEVT